MRATVSNFLDDFKQYVQTKIDVVLYDNSIPQNVANTIYNTQYANDLNVALQSHASVWGFVADLIGGATLAATAAALAAFAPVGAAAVGITSVVGTSVFAAGAGAGEAAFSTVASDLLGAFFPTFKTSNNTQPPINYTNLEQIVNNVNLKNDLFGYFKSLDTLLMSQSFQQQILSNYGLLTALQYVNGGNLVSYVDSSNDPDPLATGLTYASWQQIIPAVFTWKLQNVQYPAYLNPYDAVTSDSKGYVQLSTALYDPGTLNDVLQGAEALQDGTADDPGTFFTISGIYHDYVIFGSSLMGAYYTAWHLVDENNNDIDPSLAQLLFGVAGTTSQQNPPPLVPVQSNQPFQAANGAWYYDVQTPSGGITTWYDAFVNWAADGPPSYSPGSLLPANLQDTYSHLSVDYHPNLLPPDDLP